MEYIDDDVSEKKRLLTLLLALIFGVFAAHRFYVGRNRSAVIFLLIDLTMVGFAVTAVWSLVDCLFLLIGEFTDGDGRKVLKWT